MSSRSGRVIAILRKSFFKLSGRLDRPAYPGFTTEKNSALGPQEDHAKSRTSNKDSSILTQFELPAYQFNLSRGVENCCAQSKLNTLDLLRDCTKYPFLQSIEFIEAAPSSNLTQADENSSHRLEVESLVTTKDQYESTKLYSKCLHGFSFTCGESLPSV